MRQPKPGVERGRYLVESILACGNCHTPKSASGAPIRERDLSGGISITAPPFDGAASNITPDRDTGLGASSDSEIKCTITQGISRDGCKLQPPMEFEYYSRMADADLNAIVAYLRTVPPLE